VKKTVQSFQISVLLILSWWEETVSAIKDITVMAWSLHAMRVQSDSSTTCQARKRSKHAPGATISIFTPIRKVKLLDQ
jgi:hypothetical protein